jgi:hypothetical protein
MPDRDMLVTRRLILAPSRCLAPPEAVDARGANPAKGRADFRVIAGSIESEHRDIMLSALRGH